MQKLTVGILIYDGVQVLDFAGPFDVFSTTRNKDKPALSDPSLFDVLLVSEYPRPVSALGGMKVTPHHTIHDCPALDILVVSGGLGEREEHGNHVLLHFIRSRAKKVKTLSSVCTGAIILGKAGLLDGRRATTHWMSIERMREMLPQVEVVENVRYVEDGNIITSAGISSGIDMSLRIVAIYHGEDTARATARELEYPYPSE
jgi:transcriptional regulator GlxA family with amidase domain